LRKSHGRHEIGASVGFVYALKMAVFSFGLKTITALQDSTIVTMEGE